jgi:hypothetical protein
MMIIPTASAGRSAMTKRSRLTDRGVSELGTAERCLSSGGVYTYDHAQDHGYQHEERQEPVQYG